MFNFFYSFQVANNFEAQVHIFKDFHKNIIGKGGATIRKVGYCVVTVTLKIITNTSFQ